ncbi:hypothetical protein [Actinomadura sp. SCN-SB]|uniref:hypothetical protein n=1 Tax=Actinomadura sp. SCN-SB TaxID=3373092 RepID=UPI0037529C95
MRRLLGLAAALFLLIPATAARAAPGVPYEETRFARVASEIAKDPLYVDMDLADLIGTEARTSVRAAMTRTSRSLGVPVYFVAIPNGSEAESYGRTGAFLAGLHAHLRRDGLFLMVDARGELGAAAYGVPRRFSGRLLPFGLRYADDYDRPFAELPPRVSRALEGIAAAPPGPPATEESETGVPAFGQEHPPLEAEIWGPFFVGLLAGATIAGLLYGLFLLALLPWRTRRRRGRPAPSRTAPSRPSPRWLRRHAAKELGALGAELDPDRPGMIRAYDAARLLHDDVADRPVRGDDGAFLDLVAVIVLARQGRAARTRAKPAPTCFVNPLHGEAGRSRRKIDGRGRNPVCDGCANGPYENRILRLPDRRPHYTVPGRWQRGALGSRRPDLAADVLESLGVDS